jgi:polyisoprenoid-binding protein YceI
MFLGITGATMTTQTWNIDTTHSGVNFSVRHMVIAKVRGRFTRFAGTLGGDASDLTKAKLVAEVDADSIDTNVADRDAHLRSPDFFDAATFPKLTFSSTRIEHAGAGQYKAHGDLTIRGVTKPVVFDLAFRGQTKDPWGNDRVAFTLEGAVDRSEFGLRWNQALETGGVLVGERVEIEIEAQAVRAAAAQAA